MSEERKDLPFQIKMRRELKRTSIWACIVGGVWLLVALTKLLENLSRVSDASVENHPNIPDIIIPICVIGIGLLGLFNLDIFSKIHGGSPAKLSTTKHAMLDAKTTGLYGKLCLYVRLSGIAMCILGGASFILEFVKAHLFEQSLQMAGLWRIYVRFMLLSMGTSLTLSSLGIVLLFRPNILADLHEWSEHQGTRK